MNESTSVSRTSTVVTWIVAIFCVVAGGWPALVELGVIPCIEGGCKPTPMALVLSLAVVVIGVHLFAVALAMGTRTRAMITLAASGVAAAVAAAHLMR